MASHELSGSDREFFVQISRAGFINPFSEARDEIDLEISGLSPSSPRRERIEKVVAVTAGRIAALEREGLANISMYSGEDRRLLERAFLFELFYRFKDRFDQFIDAQMQAGDSPVKVPFYNEAMAVLEKRGFDEEACRRYIALGFQFRRAYYFIDRSLAGTSPCMKALRLNLWNNVFTRNIDLYDRFLINRMEDFSTLILGETGTGKGTAASAIGRSGFIPLDKRKKLFVESFTRSFVALNLSQFPETLIESALFGHKKGSFTGAVEDYQGVFDRCSPYGSILLDEIGEVSKPIQIKLLQVLQDRVFSPVGSQKANRFNGRVIAATNRPLDRIRKEGLFRDDFYYRLCSDIVMVPPLRQRIAEDRAELDILLGITVTRLMGKASPELVRLVKDAVSRQPGPDYPWPGNVRELEQCVRRVLLKGMYAGDSAIAETGLEGHLISGIEQGNIDAASLLSGYCCLLYQRHQTFEEVARRTGLDRRTVKKYIQDWTSGEVAAEEPEADPQA